MTTHWVGPHSHRIIYLTQQRLKGDNDSVRRQKV